LVTYIHNLFSSLLSLVAIMTALLLLPWIVLSIAKETLESVFLMRLAGIVGQTFVFTAVVTVSTRLARHEHIRLKNLALSTASIGTLLLLSFLASTNKQLHSDALISFLISLPCAVGLTLYWRGRPTPNLRGRSELCFFAVAGISLSSLWLFDLSRSFLEPHRNGAFHIVRHAWLQVHSLLSKGISVFVQYGGIPDQRSVDRLSSILLSACGLVAILCARLLMKQSVLEQVSRRCNRGVLEGLKYLFSCALLAVLATYAARRLPDAVWATHMTRVNLGPQALFIYFSVFVPVGIALVGFSAGIGIALLGRPVSPYMRENLTDVIGMIYSSTAIWMGLATAAFYGPLLLYNSPANQVVYFGIIWSASLALAWLPPKDRSTVPAIWRYIADTLVAVVPYVFLAGVLVLVSFGISRWIFQIETWQTISNYFEQCDAVLGGGSIWLCAIVLFAAALFSARSGVNSSSMHPYYLARLSETFLGEAPSGAPRDFGAYKSSGFDPCQLRLQELRPSHGYYGPVILLNCCLNVRNRQDPQVRLGENFVFSPGGCGFFPGDDDAQGGVFQDPSKYYYAGEAGVSLATSMAISGAALGSNMGYLSSIRTRLFHTAFNFRLGWWFCNPRYPGAWNGGIPRSRISCHLKEIFGNMTDHNPFVYLSDGAHFDNLGVCRG
jgi:hypothetical protein